jgi:hypothetical protein
MKALLTPINVMESRKEVLPKSKINPYTKPLDIVK